MRQELVLCAIGAVLLLTLAFGFYAYGEITSLKNSLNSLEKRPDTAAVLVNALERRVSSLEVQAKRQSATAKLLAFYDSTCNTCANDVFLESVGKTKAALAEQGIRLEEVDVSGNRQPALAVGVKTVPAFFASSSDLAANQKLVSFINSLATLSFAFSESPAGVIAQFPVTQYILSSDSCARNGTLFLEEFYSPTCPYCRRVDYANGTPYNPPSQLVFAEVGAEALQKVAEKFGNATTTSINASSYCINVHSLEDNRAVLGVNASDEALCLESVGSEGFASAEKLAEKYGLIGAPTFVVDCKYAVKVHESGKLSAALCAIRPEFCKK